MWIKLWLRMAMACLNVGGCMTSCLIVISGECLYCAIATGSAYRVALMPRPHQNLTSRIPADLCTASLGTPVCAHMLSLEGRSIWLAGQRSCCVSFGETPRCSPVTQVFAPMYANTYTTFHSYLEASRPALVLCDFMLDACFDAAHMLKLPFVITMPGLGPMGGSWPIGACACAADQCCCDVLLLYHLCDPLTCHQHP